MPWSVLVVGDCSGMSGGGWEFWRGIWIFGRGGLFGGCARLWRDWAGTFGRGLCGVGWQFGGWFAGLRADVGSLGAIEGGWGKLDFLDCAGGDFFRSLLDRRAWLGAWG